MLAALLQHGPVCDARLFGSRAGQPVAVRYAPGRWETLAHSWQSVPELPTGQLHSNEPGRSMQTPPFWQGLAVAHIVDVDLVRSVGPYQHGDAFTLLVSPSSREVDAARG